MAEYPEHKKLMAAKEESQTIGSFLDWLLEAKGYRICKYQECFTEHVLVEINQGIEALLADYFKIDLQKIAEEKDAMLEEMRAILKDSGRIQ